MGCGSSNTAGSSTEASNKKEPQPTSSAKTSNRNEPPPTNSPNASNRNEPQPATKGSKPEPKPSEGTVATGNQFVDDGVTSHNKYRAMHGSPAMKAAQDLIDYAQKYANEIAEKDTLKHSNCTMPSGERVGENLYCYWSSDPSAAPTAEMAVKSWYDEIKDYNFDNGGFSMKTGHFTQVVWQGSVELGMAWAKAAGGTTYVVANYRPAGNMMGAFDKNVLPKM